MEERFGSIAQQAVSGVPAELGTITSTGLLLDSFKHELKDYLVADWLVDVQLPPFSLVGKMKQPVDADGNILSTTTTSSWTKFEFNETTIREVRMNWKAGMQPGDRVLAVPVNGGRDVIVICRVVDAGG
ncbi:hypothetical protein [Cohnella nanjingensis]|uniref:DUF2577 domain-containing protein n=1 Tax=Cohnella nanjingensis TaxID=1387779 RepID=A0A7X0RVT2_9BACL|nr:hypothetical protein [Cohnella nanjingensis]MBB6673024.1 hypothetical protein [Cohnella nanjingensis]